MSYDTDWCNLHFVIEVMLRSLCVCASWACDAFSTYECLVHSIAILWSGKLCRLSMNQSVDLPCVSADTYDDVWMVCDHFVQSWKFCEIGGCDQNVRISAIVSIDVNRMSVLLLKLVWNAEFQKYELSATSHPAERVLRHCTFVIWSITIHDRSQSLTSEVKVYPDSRVCCLWLLSAHNA